MKKFKLDLPMMIQGVDAWIYEILKKQEIDTVREDWKGRNNEGVASFSDIPEDWRAQEIKDEPVSAKEWGIEKYGNTREVENRNFTTLEMLEAFKDGEANNELRHRETQSFEEWNRTQIDNSGYSDKMRRDTWNACKKSHNLT